MTINIFLFIHVYFYFSANNVHTQINILVNLHFRESSQVTKGTSDKITGPEIQINELKGKSYT